MLLLDTRQLPPAERADAFQSVISQASSPNRASFEDVESIHASFEVFRLGVGTVFNTRGSGFTLVRTPRHARQVEEQIIALAVPVEGTNRFQWSAGEQWVGPRDMLLVDLAAPYDYGWRGRSASYAFQVRAQDLALPMDTVRIAASQLASSDLYPLVRDHVVHVTTGAATLERDPAGGLVGQSTIDLMRALVVSAARDHRLLRETLAATTMTRVLAYVRLHLCEADLTAARIAAAHNISLRYLYKVSEAAGISIEQWIIERRLEGARADLVSPRGRCRTIAATARAWAFSDPSFFARRFRQTYGMSPQEWQRGEPAGRGEPGSG